MDYKNAGVDIEAGYKSVELMKEHIKKTMRSEVLTNIGGFREEDCTVTRRAGSGFGIRRDECASV